MSTYRYHTELVARRAADLVTVGLLGCAAWHDEQCGRLGEPEVEQLHFPSVSNPDIGGLQIAMDDTALPELADVE